jgi:hypothetical protein
MGKLRQKLVFLVCYSGNSTRGLFFLDPNAGPGWNSISAGTLEELGANGTSGVINTPLSTFDFACNFWLPLEPRS